VRFVYKGRYYRQQQEEKNPKEQLLAAPPLKTPLNAFRSNNAGRVAGGSLGNTERVVPDGGVQWLLVKPWSCCTGQCTPYRTGALPWPLKLPETEVHSFAATAYFDCCNHS
jgi:hypothetical protein